MPKNKLRSRRVNLQDDDFDTVSVFSKISNDSENSSINTRETESDGSTENSYYRIEIAIDRLYEKRLETRVASLQELLNILKTTCLDFSGTWNYIDTFLTGLENVLKRGKIKDQTLSAECLGVFCTQIPSHEVLSLLERFQNILSTILSDNTTSCKFRSSCGNALAVMLFLSTCNDYNSIKNLMKSYENIFKLSHLNNKTFAIIEDFNTFRCTALRSWTLLFINLPCSEIDEVGKNCLPLILNLLHSSNLDIRISAGETLALVYERIRLERGEDYKGPYFSELLRILTELAKDGNKNKSKNDLKRQRHTFRDVLNFLTHNWSCELTVKFGVETMDLNSYYHYFLYGILCQILGCGVNTHLQKNELVRAIFQLGPPIFYVNNDHVDKKEKKIAKRYANQYASKQRTHFLNSSRDKRSNIVDSDV